MYRKVICLMSSIFAMTFVNGIADGKLTASIESGDTSQRINLTTEGTADWAYWRLDSLQPANSKAGADDIGELTTIGNLGIQNNTSQTAWDVEFNDGTNPVSGTANDLGCRVRINSSPAIDEGFRLVVKAGVAPRILKLYIHNRETPSIIRATIGDEVLETLPPYRETGAMGNCVYTLEFSHPTTRELVVEYFCPAGAASYYTIRIGVATLSGELVYEQLKAYSPNIENGAADVPRDVELSWMSGKYAATHDVYFGIVFNDVKDASRTNPLGVLASQGQTASTYDPAGVLDFSQTYYWRVDEVNAPPDSTIFKGSVWSFTVEPIAYPIAGVSITATASSSNSAEEGPGNTINGSGLSANDLHSAANTAMWLSSITGPQPTWIQYEFDKVYKLHQMLVWNYNTSVEPVIGFGVKDAAIEYSTDGANWTTLGTHQIARAPGAAAYAPNTTIDLSGVVAKYVKLTASSNWGGMVPQYGLSEVRFFYVPVAAREPNPVSGAIDINVDNVTVSWRAGREAAKHNVYLSDSNQAVIDGTAPVTTVSQASYGPLSLDLGKTYYWRVDEVNEAETPAIWQGDVLNFSTQQYLVVDDFEDYNDFEPDRIFDTWIDGWNVPTNGSQVGYAEPPFAERTIVHSGRQSMPLNYDNSTTASYSEATANVANLKVGQDWTKYGIKTLSLWFHGDPNNSVERMYVKLNGSKVIYDGDANDIARIGWPPWNIELSSFGVNLKNVTELIIGFERSGAVGGKGKVYFDDIRLYPHQEP